jgi:hypothetical protein
MLDMDKSCSVWKGHVRSGQVMLGLYRSCLVWIGKDRSEQVMLGLDGSFNG